MNIQNFLTNLGLDKTEAQIYEELSKGQRTVVQIAKNTNINRSKIYRRLENLKNMQLVEEIVDQFTTKYQLADIGQLELLLANKEASIKQVRADMESIKNQISGNIGLNDSDSQVKFYRGKQGIKQMVWNTLKAKKAVYGYTCFPLSDFLGKEFMRKFAEEFKFRKLKFRDIFNDTYLKGNKSAINLKDSIDAIDYQSKMISKDVLNIDFQTDIYNDTVSYYNWRDGEVFGVSVVNSKIASFQKQIFKIVWKV